MSTLIADAAHARQASLFDLGAPRVDTGFAGLRRSEKVAACEHEGDGLRLDGGCFCVALLRDSAKQLGDEPEAFERGADVYLLNR